MKRLEKFFMNGLLLSVTAVALRAVGVWFSAYLAGRVGAEGVGIYQLVVSVYTLAVTFACSGITVAATQLVAGETVLKHGDPLGAVRRCLLYSLCFGSAASLLLLAAAPLIGTQALGEPLTVRPLRVLAFSLPFLAMENALSGYFTAVRRVWKSAAAQLAEQAVKVGLAIFFLTLVKPGDLEGCCLAIVGGGAVSEFVSFLLLAIFFAPEKKGLPPAAGYPMRNVTSAALPVAFSAWLRSLLFTVKQLMVPAGLTAYGLSRPEALAQFGKIGGMVFQVIMFPSAFLYAFSGLLVPELTEFRTRGETGKISGSVDGVLSAAMAFSTAAAGLFAMYGRRLGILLYGDAQTGYYILLFSPLIISMYCDGAVDGLLKGLGEQKAVMLINLADSALTLAAVWILLPRFGVGGYIAALFVSEMADDLMSTLWLTKVTGCRPKILKMLKHPVLAAIPSAAAAFALGMIRSPDGGWLRLALEMAAVTGIYCTLLMFSGIKNVEKKQRR